MGNITGTVMTPDGQFGGIGVPVTLSSKDLTLTTTTLALPPLSGTAAFLTTAARRRPSSSPASPPATTCSPCPPRRFKGPRPLCP